MCGSHHADGTPIGHHHPTGPIFRPDPRLRARRAFLGNFGRATAAVAVVTPVLWACGSDAPAPSVDAGTAGDGNATGTEPAQAIPTETAVAPEPTARPTPDVADSGNAAEEAAPSTTELRWARANLGFVSAYVLARGNTAAIVDTGVAGSANAIGTTLGTLGLTYDDVDHVILTHKHQDHAGSIAQVIAAAPSATVYAGEADLSGIDQTDIVGLVGGEDIFGFEALSTPGHTAGHMCVIDHSAGVLVAGDAIFTDGGGVVEGPERFFDDIALSRESIAAMGALSFNTLLPGHGDPIEVAADTAVAALAASF